MSTVRADVTDGDWLTLVEIAEDLKVPVATVYQWRSRGDAPVGHKFGRHVRVRRGDYEAWLMARRERVLA
ncbi:MAG TPA: helix-turn-helix domain-containing protein [Streptosporangiaceae bacterium]|jgi:excisionase family DNA binding protein